jgi:regulator of protease activity HflC (stomatin/prohibitin superfamily)
MYTRGNVALPPPLPRQIAWLKSLTVGLGPLLAVALLLFIPIFIWFFCRIEPRSGKMAILIRKTGKDLPSGEIIATKSGQKGIQLDVLSEGRYFRNPYTWGWEIEPMTDIPAGKLGVVISLFGKELPPGQIIATEGTKGIMAEVLSPGKYRLNPYAYLVKQEDAIHIRPGHIGVVNARVGDDVMNTNLPEDKKNTFLVDGTLKGVQAKVLDPGTYYLNPYMVKVVEVNLQSQRFNMIGEDIIGFLTQDGFTVSVEGTIEFAIQREKAALLTHQVGDCDEIEKKIVLPRARGFSRIEGSKHPAVEFIMGETRQKFQKDLEDHLRAKCKDWGIDIRSVLISKITVPDAIASISRDRELAVQESKKYDQQIEQAKSKAELVRQEMLAQQNKEKVDADTTRIKAVIGAEQEQSVQTVTAEKDLQVARVRFDAAKFQAESVLLKAEGQRDVIRKTNEAEASVAAGQVQAFSTGANYARYLFYQKIAPNITSILTTDQKEGLGTIFTPYLPSGKEVSR